MFERFRRAREIRKAYELAAAGRLEDALALLRAARAAGDPGGDYAEAMAFLLFQKGKWDESQSLFGEAQKQTPGSLTRAYYRALSQARLMQWDEAMATLHELAKQQPHSMGPAAARCLVLIDKPDWPAAQQAFAEARALLRDHPRKQDSTAIGLLEQCTETFAQMAKTAAEPKAP